MAITGDGSSPRMKLAQRQWILHGQVKRSRMTTELAIFNLIEMVKTAEEGILKADCLDARRLIISLNHAVEHLVEVEQSIKEVHLKMIGK